MFKRPPLRSVGTAIGVAVSLTALVAGCGQVTRPPALDTGYVRGWSAQAFSTPTEMREVVLHFGDRDRLTKLVAAGFDAWSVQPKQRRAKGKLNQAQAELAKSLGMEVEWPLRQTTFHADKGYRNYDQITARLKELVAKHPEFASLEDIGDSWETKKGTAKRDLWALHLTTGGTKPNVTIAGCHHAREIVTPEMVLGMAEHLVEGYGKDAEATALIDSRDLWIIPLVNPDAHARAVQGTDWRKNANNESGGKRRIGVDLNRNYDVAWGTVGDSGNPEADTFRGASAFSEPETQAVRDQLKRHKPVVYLTYHSFSNAVMWSWDYQSAPPTDPRLAALGKQLGEKSGYEAYQGCEMYLNSGDDVDWAHKALGALAYTVEVGGWSDGFMPSFNKIPKFWGENKPMMLHAIKAADNPGAVFGPELAVDARAPRTFQAPNGVKTAEAFVGTPGEAGTGTKIAVAGGRAALPVADGPRRPVWVHAQGTNGVWGPWQITWSR